VVANYEVYVGGREQPIKVSNAEHSVVGNYLTFTANGNVVAQFAVSTLIGFVSDSSSTRPPGGGIFG
jgi:hypothetical protein